MDKETLETVGVVALATGTVGVALWICLPGFLCAVGHSLFNCGVDPDDELARTEEDPHYFDLRDQLLQLGFKSIGMGWEETIDTPRTSTSIFTHPEHGCYAGAWRLAGGDYRVYMTTVFQDGAAVMTANYSREPNLEHDYHATGTPTHLMDVLLNEHRAAVADFVKQGHPIQRCTTPEDVVNAKRVYFYNPSVQNMFRAAKFKVFCARAQGVIVAPAITIAPLLMLKAGPLLSWGFGFFISVVIGVVVPKIQVGFVKEQMMKAKTAEQQSADRQRRRGQR
jgi:hypothetical protein